MKQADANDRKFLYIGILLLVSFLNVTKQISRGIFVGDIFWATILLAVIIGVVLFFVENWALPLLGFKKKSSEIGSSPPSSSPESGPSLSSSPPPSSSDPLANMDLGSSEPPSLDTDVGTVLYDVDNSFDLPEETEESDIEAIRGMKEDIEVDRETNSTLFQREEESFSEPEPLSSPVGEKSDTSSPFIAPITEERIETNQKDMSASSPSATGGDGAEEVEEAEPAPLLDFEPEESFSHTISGSSGVSSGGSSGLSSGGSSGRAALPPPTGDANYDELVENLHAAPVEDLAKAVTTKMAREK